MKIKDSVFFFTSQGPKLRGHSLPPGVPVNSLFSKYCKPAGHDEDQEDLYNKLRNFLSNTFNHLRAFLSRQHQYNQMKERWGIAWWRGEDNSNNIYFFLRGFYDF